MKKKTDQQRNRQISEVLKELIGLSHSMEQIMAPSSNGKVPLDPSLIYDETDGNNTINFNWDSVYPRVSQSSVSNKLPEHP